MAGLGTGAPIVKVYHERSMILPDVSRVLACLYEKEIPFERETFSSYSSLLRLQASSRVPVPFYDGPNKFLEESREICRHIAETYEDQGYPFLLGKDSLERASIEEWLHHEEHNFNPPSRSLFCHLAFPVVEENDDIDLQTRKLEEVLEVYEQRLGDSQYLAGNKFTLADLVHLPNSHHITNSDKFLYLYDSRKNVQRWWHEISSRGSWQKVLKIMHEVELQNKQEELDKQQQRKQEELEKQQRRQWRRQHPPTSRPQFRLDPREQPSTKPHTILVPPPVSIIPASPTTPQAEEPHLIKTSPDEAPVSSSLSIPTTHKPSDGRSKYTTISTTHEETPPASVQSTPKIPKKSPIPVERRINFFTPATSPTTAEKPSRTGADKSRIRDASLHSEAAEIDLPTKSKPSSSKKASDNLHDFYEASRHTDEAEPYAESTSPKPSEMLDEKSETDGHKNAVDHAETSPRSAKEDSDRLRASGFWTDNRAPNADTQDKKSVRYTERIPQRPVGNISGRATDQRVTYTSPGKPRSSEAHQKLQSEQWHATAGLSNLKGETDDIMPPTQQAKPSKDVQDISSQDSEQASTRPLAQEPVSMDAQLAEGPEKTTRTPDQRRDVSSMLWQQAAAVRPPYARKDAAEARRFPADRRKDASLPKRVRDDTQAIPLYDDDDDDDDNTNQEARETASAPRRTRAQDPYDVSEGTSSRSQSVSAPHDAVPPPKQATSEGPYARKDTVEARRFRADRRKDTQAIPLYDDDDDDDDTNQEARETASAPRRTRAQDPYDASEGTSSRSQPVSAPHDAVPPPKQATSEGPYARKDTVEARRFRADRRKDTPLPKRVRDDIQAIPLHDDDDTNQEARETASAPRRTRARDPYDTSEGISSRSQPVNAPHDAVPPPKQATPEGPYARKDVVEARRFPADLKKDAPLPKRVRDDTQAIPLYGDDHDSNQETRETASAPRRTRAQDPYDTSEGIGTYHLSSSRPEPVNAPHDPVPPPNQAASEGSRRATAPYPAAQEVFKQARKSPASRSIVPHDAQGSTEEEETVESSSSKAHPLDSHLADARPPKQYLDEDGYGAITPLQTGYTGDPYNRKQDRGVAAPKRMMSQDDFEETKMTDSASLEAQTPDHRQADAPPQRQQPTEDPQTSASPSKIRYSDDEDTAKQAKHAHQKLQSEQWHAATAGLSNLKGETDDFMPPTQQAKPSKDVQHISPQDAEQANTRPLAQEPVGMDGQLVQGPERTARTPHTDQRRDVNSMLWQQAANVQGIAEEDRTSSDHGGSVRPPYAHKDAVEARIVPADRRKDASFPKHAPNDTQAVPLYDDDHDTSQEARETASAPRRTTAPQDPVPPPKQAAFEGPRRATTPYPAAQEIIKQARKSPASRSIVPHDAQGSTEEEGTLEETEFVEPASSRAQPVDYKRTDTPSRKRGGVEDPLGATSPVERKYADGKDTTKHSAFKPRNVVGQDAEDTSEEAEARNSALFRRPSPDSWSAAATPSKEAAAEDALRVSQSPPTRYPRAEETSKAPASIPTDIAGQDARDVFRGSKVADSTPLQKKYPDAKDAAKKSKVTFEETKISDSAPSRGQPLDSQRVDAPSWKKEATEDPRATSPVEKRRSDVEDTTKQSRDNGFKPRQIVGEDAQGTYKETKASDPVLYTWQAATTPTEKIATEDGPSVTPPSKRRSPSDEDSIKQSRGTAPAPRRSTSHDANVTFQDSKPAKSMSSGEQPLRSRQEVEDSRSKTSAFDKTRPYVEDSTSQAVDTVFGPRQPADSRSPTKVERTPSVYEQDHLVAQDSHEQPETLPTGGRADGSILKHQQDPVVPSIPEEKSSTPPAPPRARVRDGHPTEEPFKGDIVDDRKRAPPLLGQEPTSQVQRATKLSQEAAPDGELSTVDKWQRTSVPLQGDDVLGGSTIDQKPPPTSEQSIPGARGASEVVEKEKRMVPPARPGAQTPDVQRAPSSFSGADTGERDGEPVQMQAPTLHDQGAKPPESTQAQSPFDAPHDSVSARDVPTDALDKTNVSKPTSTEGKAPAPTSKAQLAEEKFASSDKKLARAARPTSTEGMAPTAGPAPTSQAQLSEQKFTPSDKKLARAAPESSKEDTSFSAPEKPQTIFRQEARPSAAITKQVPSPDAHHDTRKIQHVTLANFPPDDSPIPDQDSIQSAQQSSSSETSKETIVAAAGPTLPTTIGKDTQGSRRPIKAERTPSVYQEDRLVAQDSHEQPQTLPTVGKADGSTPKRQQDPEEKSSTPPAPPRARVRDGHPTEEPFKGDIVDDRKRAPPLLGQEPTSQVQRATKLSQEAAPDGELSTVDKWQRTSVPLQGDDVLGGSTIDQKPPPTSEQSIPGARGASEVVEKEKRMVPPARPGAQTPDVQRAPSSFSGADTGERDGEPVQMQAPTLHDQGAKPPESTQAQSPFDAPHDSVSARDVPTDALDKTNVSKPTSTEGKAPAPTSKAQLAEEKFASSDKKLARAARPTSTEGMAPTAGPAPTSQAQLSEQKFTPSDKKLARAAPESSKEDTSFSAPEKPQTIFRQEARPSAAITKQVPSPDAHHDTRKIQHVTLANFPPDDSPIPDQDSIQSAQQSSSSETSKETIVAAAGPTLPTTIGKDTQGSRRPIKAERTPSVYQEDRLVAQDSHEQPQTLPTVGKADGSTPKRQQEPEEKSSTPPAPPRARVRDGHPTEEPFKGDIVDDRKRAPPLLGQEPTSQVQRATKLSQEAAPDGELSTVDKWQRTSVPLQGDDVLGGSTIDQRPTPTSQQSIPGARDASEVVEKEQRMAPPARPGAQTPNVLSAPSSFSAADTAERDGEPVQMQAPTLHDQEAKPPESTQAQSPFDAPHDSVSARDVPTDALDKTNVSKPTSTEGKAPAPTSKAQLAEEKFASSDKKLARAARPTSTEGMAPTAGPAPTSQAQLSEQKFTPSDKKLARAAPESSKEDTSFSAPEKPQTIFGQEARPSAAITKQVPSPDAHHDTRKIQHVTLANFPPDDSPIPDQDSIQSAQQSSSSETSKETIVAAAGPTLPTTIGKDTQGSRRPIKAERTPSVYQEDRLVAQDSHEQPQTLPTVGKADGSTPKRQQDPEEKSSTPPAPPRARVRDGHPTEEPFKGDIVDDRKRAPPLLGQEPTSQVQRATKLSQEAAPDGELSTVDKWQRTSVPLQGDDVLGGSTIDQRPTPTSQQSIPGARDASEVVEKEQRMAPPARPGAQTPNVLSAPSSFSAADTAERDGEPVQMQAPTLHDQGAKPPESTQAQSPFDAPHDSVSARDVPTDALDKTNVSKPTSTEGKAPAPTSKAQLAEEKFASSDKKLARAARPTSTEGMAPTAGPAPTSQAQLSEQKFTPSDKKPEKPQTIFRQEVRPSTPITKQVPSSDAHHDTRKIQQVNLDNFPTVDSSMPRAPEPGKKDSPASNTQIAKAGVQETVPDNYRTDELTVPSVSNEKQGSYAGSSTEPHEGSSPDAHGAADNEEITKYPSRQAPVLEYRTAADSYVRPTSVSEVFPAIKKSAPSDQDSIQSAKQPSPAETKKEETIVAAAEQTLPIIVGKDTQGMRGAPTLDYEPTEEKRADIPEQKSGPSDRDSAHSTQSRSSAEPMDKELNYSSSAKPHSSATPDQTRDAQPTIGQQAPAPGTSEYPSSGTHHTSGIFQEVAPDDHHIVKSSPGEGQVYRTEPDFALSEGPDPYSRSVIGEKTMRPPSRQAQSSDSKPDPTQNSADEPSTRSLPNQVTKQHAETQAPPPLMRPYDTESTQDVTSDTLGKAKSLKPSSIDQEATGSALTPDTHLGSAPGEVGRPEQDSANSIQKSSSSEPQKEQSTVAAPNQAKASQATSEVVTSVDQSMAPSELLPVESTVAEAEESKVSRPVIAQHDIRHEPDISEPVLDDDRNKEPVSREEQDQRASEPREGPPPDVNGTFVDRKTAPSSSQAQRPDAKRDLLPLSVDVDEKTVPPSSQAQIVPSNVDVGPSSDEQSTTRLRRDQEAQAQLPAATKPPPPFEAPVYSKPNQDAPKPFKLPSADQDVMSPNVVPALAPDTQFGKVSDEITHVGQNSPLSAQDIARSAQRPFFVEPTKENGIVAASDQTNEARPISGQRGITPTPDKQRIPDLRGAVDEKMSLQSNQAQNSDITPDSALIGGDVHRTSGNEPTTSSVRDSQARPPAGTQNVHAGFMEKTKSPRPPSTDQEPMASPAPAPAPDGPQDQDSDRYSQFSPSVVSRKDVANADQTNVSQAGLREPPSSDAKLPSEEIQESSPDAYLTKSEKPLPKKDPVWPPHEASFDLSSGGKPNMIKGDQASTISDVIPSASEEVGQSENSAVKGPLSAELVSSSPEEKWNRQQQTDQSSTRSSKDNNTEASGTRNPNTSVTPRDIQPSPLKESMQAVEGSRNQQQGDQAVFQSKQDNKTQAEETEARDTASDKPEVIRPDSAPTTGDAYRTSSDGPATSSLRRPPITDQELVTPLTSPAPAPDAPQDEDSTPPQLPPVVSRRDIANTDQTDVSPAGLRETARSVATPPSEKIQEFSPDASLTKSAKPLLPMTGTYPVQPPHEASVDLSSDGKPTMIKGDQANTISNVSLSASRAVGQSENSAVKGPPSDDSVSSSRQKNLERTSPEEKPKQQRQSSTRPSKDDSIEASETASPNILTTSGDIQSSPLNQSSPIRENNQTAEGFRNQQQADQDVLQPRQDTGKRIEETEAQDTSTDYPEDTNGASQRAALEQQQGKNVGRVQRQSNDTNNSYEPTKDAPSIIQAGNKPESSSRTPEEPKQQVQREGKTQGGEAKAPASESGQPEDSPSKKGITNQSQSETLDKLEDQTSSATPNRYTNSSKSDGSTSGTKPTDTNDNDPLL